MHLPWLRAGPVDDSPFCWGTRSFSWQLQWQALSLHVNRRRTSLIKKEVCVLKRPKRHAWQLTRTSQSDSTWNPATQTPHGPSFSQRWGFRFIMRVASFEHPADAQVGHELHRGVRARGVPFFSMGEPNSAVACIYCGTNWQGSLHVCLHFRCR